VLSAVIANMRGESPEAVATLLMQQEGLRGLQGPTISPVYSLDGSSSGAAAKHGFYACVICVAKKNLYPSVKALQKVRGYASYAAYARLPVGKNLAT
jgi:ATP phosphoribosyltransferase